MNDRGVSLISLQIAAPRFKKFRSLGRLTILALSQERSISTLTIHLEMNTKVQRIKTRLGRLLYFGLLSAEAGTKNLLDFLVSFYPQNLYKYP